MKLHLIYLSILCCILSSCHIPRSTIIENNEDETQPADMLETIQPSEIINTPSLQVASETSESVSTETITFTPEITGTSEPGYGGIEGTISGYPYGAIPSLVVVAYKKEPPYPYRYEILIPGSTYYSMTAGEVYYLQTGKYQMVAYDTYGHAGGCTTIIEVKKDEMVTCNISNWSGSYPSKPGDIP